MTELNENNVPAAAPVAVAKTGNPYLIPVAIVVAGGLVAFAIFLGGGASSPTATGTTGGTQPTQQTPPPAGNTDAVNPVTEADHIKGNPNAPVKIVEYSDYECPFCKRFHDTMNQIMDKYGESGEVAWVYRHFPLDQLHPVKARAEAVAAECANELGGNDAFWQFSDRFFELTPSNNQTDLETVIPQIVREIGLDEAAFDTCFTSGKYDEHIQSDFDNAVATGGRGTPWSVVIGSDGKTYPLNGAQPPTAIEQLIGIANVEN